MIDVQINTYVKLLEIDTFFNVIIFLILFNYKK